MIKNVVRWFPGYLIRNKMTGELAIVKFDYSYAFGGIDYNSLSIYELDDNLKILCNSAWKSQNDYELVDSDHLKENFEKIAQYEAWL